MSKTWLIISREYLSRVKKKTFILTTILTPIGFVIFWIALIFIMSSGVEDKKIAILDPSDVLQFEEVGKLRDGMVMFSYPKKELESLKESFEEDGYDAILHVPEQELDSLTKTFNVHYYSNDDIGITTKKQVNEVLKKHVRKLKMGELGVSSETLKMQETTVNVVPKNISNAEEEISSSRVEIASVLGGAMMFLIYLVIFIYGNMVMRSVMEEKTNRIVEVLISSVKPFQLMLGKIIGVGAVGLTQFAIWGLTFPLLYMGVAFLFSGKIMEMQESLTTSTKDGAGDMDQIMVILQELQNFNWGYIIFLFIIFFLLGYILYASLFAAVGAAMGDDWGEGQSLTLIVGIPVVIAFYLGMASINNPSSSLAFWSSMVPLFSPIVMPARLVFDPPLSEIIMSIVLLLLSCLFFIWLSGRIYRVGILMYGKKTSIKDFVQWMFRKD